MKVTGCAMTNRAGDPELNRVSVSKSDAYRGWF